MRQKTRSWHSDRDVRYLVFFFGIILPAIILIGIVALLWNDENDDDWVNPEPQPYRTIHRTIHGA